MNSGVFCFKTLGVSAVSWLHHSETRCFVFMRFGVYAAFVIPFPHCSDWRNSQFQISAFSKTARFTISDLRTTKSILESNPPWMTDLRRDAAPQATLGKLQAPVSKMGAKLWKFGVLGGDIFRCFSTWWFSNGLFDRFGINFNFFSPNIACDWGSHTYS